MHVIYTFNKDGYFVSASDRPLDPVRGTYAEVNPLNGTLEPVPGFDFNTQRARFVDGAWIVEDIPVIAPEPVPAPESEPEVAEPEPTVEELKIQLKDQIDWQRKLHESSGIVIEGGHVIGTLISDQNRINTTITTAALAGIDNFKFQASSGWVEMTLDQLREISKLIAHHVQDCFEAAYNHHMAIDAIDDIDALKAYDVTKNWPEKS